MLDAGAYPYERFQTAEYTFWCPIFSSSPTTISTMGKKQKEETPNINATPNRDIIQRLNFLYQASVYLQSLEPSASIPISNHPSASGKSRSKSTQKTAVSLEKKKKHKRKYSTGDLARNYVQCMRIVGQKTTVKMYEEDFPCSITNCPFPFF